MNTSILHPLRRDLPELPKRLGHLPIDERGYPVPWFVQWFHPDGAACIAEPDYEVDHPDFRVVDARKKVRAVQLSLCWICGEPLGGHRAFLIGPMCAINRINSEPPSHRGCATFAARACPFLVKPHMVRRENDLPEGYREAPGIMEMRNPGVTLMWLTHRYKVTREGLFELGDPEDVEWFAEGRTATRAEVEHSLMTGFLILLEAAKRDGAEAVKQCEKARIAALRLLPQ